jgi:sugar phosphate permease
MAAIYILQPHPRSVAFSCLFSLHLPAIMAVQNEQTEKHSSYEVEDVTPSKIEQVPEDVDHGFTKQEQKRILRHVDRRLVLTCGLLFCICLMDRTNLGIAVLSGMRTDLNLIGDRYNIITVVFMPTYALSMPIANIILKKAGARAFLPTVCLLWGITLLGMGFVKVWSQLIPLRLLLGVFEAGCFPGCAYLVCLNTFPTCNKLTRDS